MTSSMVKRTVLAMAMVGSAGAHAGRPKAPDKKIESLFKAAAACPVENDDFSRECAAMDAWDSESDGFDSDKVHEFLMQTLEKGTPAERAVAGSRLDVTRAKNGVDRAIAVATKETAPIAMKPVAHVLNTKLDAGQIVKLKALIQAASPEMAAEVVGETWFYNHDPAYIAMIAGFATDPRQRVRSNVMISVGNAAPENDPVACKAILAGVNDDDNSVESNAAMYVVRARCANAYEPLLNKLEKRGKAKKEATGGYLHVDDLCEAEPSVRAHATKVGLTYADNASWSTRIAALQMVEKCDPVAAKKLATTQASDKEKLVSDRAKEWLAKHK